MDSPSYRQVVAGRSFENWGGYPRVQWLCRSDWTEKLVISLLSANEGGHSLAKGWAITVIHALLPSMLLFSVFLPIQGHGSHYWLFPCISLTGFPEVRSFHAPVSMSPSGVVLTVRFPH